MKTRRSGILLHPTSLPSPYGIGDFGPEAYSFVDFLRKAGQKFWQVLPLRIPDETGSPYASSSAFAGNWLLVSPDLLVAQGLLPESELPRERKVGFVNYDNLIHDRKNMLDRSLRYFDDSVSERLKKAFWEFKKRESWWLRDFSLFMAIKDFFGGRSWHRWSDGLARRNPDTLRLWAKTLGNGMRIYEYGQWLFFRQWESLRAYANRRGIQIIGDVPFFVRHDSVDVWSHRRLFMLDKRNLPRVVSGVPPDYFSSRGQIWRDPQYDWKAMEQGQFTWWVQRLGMVLRLYDKVRLDHFRGYEAVWHIRRGSLTARNGHWSPVPGDKLFTRMCKFSKHMPFIAEDLGLITDDVTALRKKFGFPSMRVLQFGFSLNAGNPHAIKNLPLNAVVYTGTHDNNTAQGWILDDAPANIRRHALAVLKADKRTFAWKLIQAGMKSRADTFIAPLQDVLGLGSEARMNTPSTKRKNWRWRLKPAVLTDQIAKKLRKLSTDSGR